MKKDIQKTSGTRKQYKQGQLVCIDNHIYRIERNKFFMHICECNFCGYNHQCGAIKKPHGCKGNKYCEEDTYLTFVK